MKKNQSEMNNTISDIKNTLAVIKSRLYEARGLNQKFVRQGRRKHSIRLAKIIKKNDVSLSTFGQHES